MSLVFLFVVAAVAFPFPAMPLRDLVKTGVDPAPCCLPGKEFQWTEFETVATWDAHGDNAGYAVANLQVDQVNNLLYAESTRVNPTPKVSMVHMWLTPGALQGQWFHFYKIPNTPDCWVRNLTTKPDIFNPICFGPPFAYKGEANQGTHPVSIWDQHGGSYNKSHFVQMDHCLPTFELGLGINDAGDWEERLTNFVNFAMKVADPSKFIPPSQCKPLVTSLPELESMNRLLSLGAPLH